jgi:hypothetical protein
MQISEEIARALGQWTAEKIAEAVAPLKQKIAEVETKQADLAEWKFCGTWTTGFYHKNNFVVADGSLWICLADTHLRPGDDPRCWQLCTKRGRDGRDVQQRAPTPHRNGGAVERRT